MSLNTLAVSATLLVLPFAALAEDAARVYEGMAGAAPIVMKLEGDGDSVSGQYFYRSHRFDIDLYGEEKKGALQLTSNLTGDRLRLKTSGAGFAGELTTKRGKKLPVDLRAAALPPGALPPDLPEDLGLYEKLQLAGLALKPEKTEKIDGREIEWRIEPSSRNRMFRIVSGYPAPVTAAVNRSLAQIQWRNVSNYFGCPGSGGGPGYEDMDVQQPYLSDAYLSVATSESWNCAGSAHPDAGIDAHSFDARTGKEIQLDEFIRFGKGPVPAKDSDAWYDYRGKTFAPALVELLKRFHPKEMKKPKSEDDCDYTDPEVWNFPTWRLTEKGLYVGAIFARAMRVCDDPDWSVIPYSALNEGKPKQEP